MTTRGSRPRSHRSRSARRRPIADVARAPLVGLLVGLVAAGCGGAASSSSAIVATAPAEGGSVTSGGGSTISGSGSTAIQTGGTRTVLAPLGLNMHDQPSASGAIVGTLGEGTVVTVLGHSGTGVGWYQVKGVTTTGWIDADPQYSSPRHFQDFESTQHGFSTLYPDNWTFSDSGGAAVVFTPMTADGQRITVSTGATLDALGAPGKAGYAVISGDTVEVFGVTGTLRLFDRGQSAPAGTTAPLTSTAPPATVTASPSPGVSPDTAPHFAEIRLAIKSTAAIRIDFDYNAPADLDLFQDVYHSMKLFAALPTPTPGAPPSP